MKVKAVFASTAALLLGFTMAAHAEPVFFSGSLGNSINATDILSVQCGTGTASLRADIEDNGGLTDGVGIRVTVLDPRGRAVSQVSSPAVPASPEAVLGSSGPGGYLVIIQKAAEVAPLTVENYNSVIRCVSSTLADTPTAALLIQNN